MVSMPFVTLVYNISGFAGFSVSIPVVTSKLVLFSRKTFTVGRLRLKCDGTRAETRFRLPAKWTSPFKSVGVSVQSTTGSRGVCISCSNAGYTMFRGSVKSTSYPLHSPVSPSLPLPSVTVCHHISTGLYHMRALSGKHLYFAKLAKCLPGHCDRVPMARALGHSKVPNGTNCPHTSPVCLLATNQPWENNGKSRPDK